MVKVCKEYFPKTNGFYMDGYLKSNLDIIKDAVRKDLDFVMVVDGMEGAGKSVFAQQIAFYLDNDFNMKRLTFNADEFKKAIVTAKKYQAVVFDEALRGLSARQSLYWVNIALVNMLAEIRQKNLFVIIVLPSFFDLDKNQAVWRSRILLHVYMKQGFTRGNFTFYNSNKKKILYLLGKKTYNYYATRPNFFGGFTNFYTVDEVTYRKKKLDCLKVVIDKNPQIKVRRALDQRNRLMVDLHNNYGWTAPMLAEKTGLKENQIRYVLRTVRDGVRY